MFAKCPVCSKKAIPLWKKFFQNNTYNREFRCENCRTWLVLSYRWIAIYILSSFIIQGLVAFIFINSQPMVFVKSALWWVLTIPIFVVLVPINQHK